MFSRAAFLSFCWFKTSVLPYANTENRYFTHLGQKTATNFFVNMALGIQLIGLIHSASSEHIHTMLQLQWSLWIFEQEKVTSHQAKEIPHPLQFPSHTKRQKQKQRSEQRGLFSVFCLVDLWISCCGLRDPQEKIGTCRKNTAKARKRRAAVPQSEHPPWRRS